MSHLFAFLLMCISAWSFNRGVLGYEINKSWELGLGKRTLGNGLGRRGESISGSC